MPRENIHWHLFSAAAAELPDGNLRTAIFKYRDAARIGTMSPDAPYYYNFGGNPFESVAERIHGGNGEDTLAPVRQMLLDLHHFPRQDREFYFAFIAGFLSHLATDIVFHPFVYAVTGDYYDKDLIKRHRTRADHRLLETFLERLKLSEVHALTRERLVTSWNNLKPAGQKKVASLLEASLPYSSANDKLDSTLVESSSKLQSDSVWLKALWQMSIFQRLFVDPVLSAFVWVLDRAVFQFIAPKLHGMAVLFIPMQPVPENLKKVITFAHPVTGEKQSTSITELEQRACARLKLWFTELARITDTDLFDPTDAFRDIRGESLNTGIIGGRNSDVRFFTDADVFN